MPEVFHLELSNGKTHAYQIKPSQRAKYIRIKLIHSGELSVTLPARTSQKQAHNFIKSKALWIEKHLSKLPKDKEKTIPSTLNLELLNELWQVRTEQLTDDNPELQVDTKNKTLYFSGNELQIDYFYILVADWLKKKSQATFINMLEATAEEFGFHFSKLSIRAQKTRWGSCSSSKNISLNCKLLFMPEKVVKYVMIHELCHTLQMNHSQKFWGLVEECDPHFKEHRKLLKNFDGF